MPRHYGATIDTPLLRNYQFRIARCTIITNIVSQEFPAEGRKCKGKKITRNAFEYSSWW
jgi:hypothetical protein